MTNSKSRHIQILRGLAIIAVVCIHNMPGGLWQICVRPFLNFPVGLFLFLSGMLSNARNWKPRKRIAKVMIPYVLWTLIYVVIYNLFDPVAIPMEFLKNLVTADAAGMLYYIFIYCEFTLLIPVIDKLARSKYRYLGFLITPAEIILMRMIPLMTQWYVLPGFLRTLRGISCLGWFTYFYLGYLMGNDLLTVRQSTKTWAGILAASIPLQMLKTGWQLSAGVANCGTQMKLSTVLTGVCAAVLAYRFVHGEKGYRSKTLEFIGDNSFGIYFSHCAVMWLLEILPFYSSLVRFPLNVVAVVAVNLGFIVLGKQILGKYGRYLGL